MSKLSHLDEAGRAHMVDIGAKPATQRIATAKGEIAMSSELRALIASNAVPKGDVVAAARIAGIMAAKRTAELIPLCHPLPLSSIAIDLTPTETGFDIAATVTTNGPTGVEMEALTAVSVAALTLYDMCKAVDKSMRIGNIRLSHKSGGKSGAYNEMP